MQIISKFIILVFQGASCSSFSILNIFSLYKIHWKYKKKFADFIKFNENRIGFPFAKLLRNFCGTKRKIFLSVRISFARKKQQFARKNNNLRNHSQKSFQSKLPFSAFAKLNFCAIPQFRKNQTVGDGGVS